MFSGFYPKLHSDRSFARVIRGIDLYTRDGRSYNLSVIAVDVVDARYETMYFEFRRDAEAVAKQVAKSDVVLRKYDGESKVFAFTACSYQAANSGTSMYAVPNR